MPATLSPGCCEGLAAPKQDVTLIALKGCVTRAVMTSHGAVGEQKEPSLQVSFPRLPWVIQEMWVAGRKPPHIFSEVAFKQNIQQRTHKLYIFPFKV